MNAGVDLGWGGGADRWVGAGIPSAVLGVIVIKLGGLGAACRRINKDGVTIGAYHR